MRISTFQYVVGSLFAPDNTCEICRAGYQSRCVPSVSIGSIGTQAERARVPLADGTLVTAPGQPAPESTRQALRSPRPGGHIGYVGLAHHVELDGMELFFAEVHPHGGPRPTRHPSPGWQSTSE